ncbi:hypothetical protein OCV55_04000 [Clostridium ammoniilyticum]|uniref:Uncharacterized protein n=2 Tax=Faecalibacillus TaxID=2678885 RepID=A0ABT2SSM0_9FIRM|nr:hypothetical protein [[Clostridium] ammoniilyticum]MCU6737842.1 hypothetical protein [[Clostridium] ammoniilyticum]SCH33952.1 Uncharacterised protein [uncultured Clostridium sp.]
MKKSSIIAIGLSTLLVVCNALPMNNHVESKKEEVISQKEASKKKIKKKDVSKDETDESDETVNDTSKQTAEENTIQEEQESVKSDVQTQEKTSNQNTHENKIQKKVEIKQTPAQPVESNQSSVTPSQPTSNGNTTNAQQTQKEEQTKILRVTYWVKCDCGKELTHSIDYKDYESYYNSNDYSVKILINQLLDEGHCAGNEEVCGASHYRYGTNENWIKG